MKKIGLKVWQVARAHRLLSVAALIIVAWGGYAGATSLFGDSVGASYVVGTAQKGTLVVSVSGSGQVAATQQVDVKPKSSGEVIAVIAKTGQQVRSGAVLAYLDARDAQKAARDAQLNLESAQVSLEKLKRNQDFDRTTTAEDLNQTYRDALNRVSTSFLDLPELVDAARSFLDEVPELMDAARSIVYEGDCEGSGVCEYTYVMEKDVKSEFVFATSRARSDLEAAVAAYEPNFQSYRALRLDASRSDIVSIAQDTEQTATLLAQALKSEQNLLAMLVSDINKQTAESPSQPALPQLILSHQSTLSAAIGTTNSTLSGLSSVQRGIDSTQRSLSEGNISNPLDIAGQENVVRQRQATLQDAKEALGDSVIRAPFDGVVTKVNIKKGDQASTGTAAVTVITHQRIATLSLNEVDVAKIQVGQKVTLTFDAVSNLTITGQVLDVDALGTVSQSVVTYGMTIGFDTEDERIRPGMTTSAAIIVATKTDVLMVPNGAIKSQGNAQYVQVPDGIAAGTARISAAATTLQQKTVQTGLTNDTMTEIISGLAEGDMVVTRTVTTTATTQTQATQSEGAGIRVPGGFGGGGGFR